MKKQLLLSMGLLCSTSVITSALTEINEIQPNNNDNIPIINSAKYENNKVNINWDVEIDNNSIFSNENFENISLDLPNGLVNSIYINGNGYYIDGYGNRRGNDAVRNSLKITSGAGYNGTVGSIATKTNPNNGWDYTYYSYLPIPNGVAQKSSYTFNGWKQLEVDKPAIVRIKGKGNGRFAVGVTSGWSGNSLKDNNITWAENLSAEEFKNRLINHMPIKINNPLNTSRVNYHLATGHSTNYNYDFLLSVGNIEIQNNQWVFQPKAWYGAWSDCVRPEQSVVPAQNRKVESISIGKSLYTLESIGGGAGGVNISNSNWTNYSFNLNIPTSQAILDTKRYFRVLAEYNTSETFQVDDLSIAYAPKSKLYRDGKLILTGYTVEFQDSNVSDNAKPNTPVVNMSYEDNNIKLNWNAVTDNGTSYSYQVSSVNEFNEESPKSTAKVVTITSGIKNYEIYLNDKLVGTTTANSYKLTNKITASDKIKVIAVDNTGNKSSSENIDIPSLTVQAKSNENMIRLDWTMNDLKDKNFKVYQKKPGSSEFQSISATNFEDVKQVKVLNIHPNMGESVTFTTWDGETLTLPTSALLKKWMEEPNNENSKGYGKGIIEVTPVTIEEFNSNPDKYLKNEDGSWKYDVVFKGSWDSNGLKHFNNSAITAMQKYIADGKGYLAGHDTTPSANTLLNISNDCIYLGHNEVVIRKKGLLTNYPWNIGDIGTKLKVPMSHVTYGTNAIGKDNWLMYTADTWRNNSATTINNPDYNYYLMTYNNTAMIQTGHSSGGATIDEQKILANTLFYLNQLSSNNYLDDYSGQDINAPNKPTITGHTFTEDGFININFNTVNDNGSTYSYYVESNSKKDSIVTTSNIETITITSGLKGYSYVIDNNATTIPDNTIEQTSNSAIKLKTNNEKELYVHIKAIDNAGNSSETLHYRVTDMNVPVLNFELRPSTWTNKEVTIIARATDNDSGVKNITLPNGTIVKSSEASFIVNKNGLYTFKCLDYMGNEGIYNLTITNIDKNKPTVTISNNKNWTNKDVQVTITATDE